MDFDKREQELDQQMVDRFYKFQFKETCLMCRIVEKYEKILGKKETEKMFLTDFDERDHNLRTCFLDCFIFLKLGDGLHGFNSEQMKKYAIDQYEQVLSFVKGKTKNTF
jgi:hypothetical protein